MASTALFSTSTGMMLRRSSRSSSSRLTGVRSGRCGSSPSVPLCALFLAARAVPFDVCYPSAALDIPSLLPLSHAIVTNCLSAVPFSIVFRSPLSALSHLAATLWRYPAFAAANPSPPTPPPPARPQTDVVIDLVCYRKYGHNEIDEPMFTQPAMYSVIKKKKNPFEIYKEKLISAGLVAKEEAAAISKRVTDELQRAFEESKNYVPRARDWLSSYWAGFKGPDQQARIR